MVPGPWSVGRLMGGFCVKDDKFNILAEMRGSRIPPAQHRRNADLMAAVPELVETLLAAEAAYGYMPSSNMAAMRVHGKIVRTLNMIRIEVASVQLGESSRT